MGIEHVHELTELLIGMVGGSYPVLVRVSVADEFSKVDDATEHVTQTIEILDDFEELISGTPGIEDAVGEKLSTDKGCICEGNESIRMG